MADLKVFGTTFANVSGIKAEDSNGNTATYIQPTGSISITENSENIDVSGYASATVNVPGGTTPTGTKNISANGTDIDVAEYAYVDVAVPNSYSAEDEGKVVSNGALVSQSSDTCTTNGTVDTTLINSLSVSVPNTYSAGDEGKVVSSGALVSQSSTSYNNNGTYDTTLYNSVTVNVSGGGGSGSGLQLLDTVSVSSSNALQFDIDPDWFVNSDYVMIVPNVTLSSADWIYLAIDQGTSTTYTDGTVTGIDERYAVIIRKGTDNKYFAFWYSSAQSTSACGKTFAGRQSYIRFYTYVASKTMTGTFAVYGVNF